MVLSPARVGHPSRRGFIYYGTKIKVELICKLHFYRFPLFFYKYAVQYKLHLNITAIFCLNLAVAAGIIKNQNGFHKL